MLRDVVAIENTEPNSECDKILKNVIKKVAGDPEKTQLYIAHASFKNIRPSLFMRN